MWKINNEKNVHKIEREKELVSSPNKNNNFRTNEQNATYRRYIDINIEERKKEKNKGKK